MEATVGQKMVAYIFRDDFPYNEIERKGVTVTKIEGTRITFDNYPCYDINSINTGSAIWDDSENNTAFFSSNEKLQEMIDKELLANSIHIILEGRHKLNLVQFKQRLMSLI